MDQNIYQNILTFDDTNKLEKIYVMGMCVDQVCFVKKESKRQVLKFSLSLLQCPNIILSLYLRITHN